MTGGNDTKADEDIARKAFISFARYGVERMPAEEVKSLNVSTNTAGGYLATDDFRSELIKNLVEISPVRQAARVMNTSAGTVILPKRTGAITAAWTAELAAARCDRADLWAGQHPGRTRPPATST